MESVCLDVCLKSNFRLENIYKKYYCILIVCMSCFIIFTNTFFCMCNYKKKNMNLWVCVVKLNKKKPFPW